MVIPRFRRSPEGMRRLFDRMSRHYHWPERVLGPRLDEVVACCVATIPDAAECTALEYACGTGLFSMKADFSGMAREMRCDSFREREIAHCMVLESTPPRGAA